MEPGDIVVLNPKLWDEKYEGRLAMVLGLTDEPPDEDFSDQLIVIADPILPGETIRCWTSELLPFEPQSSNVEPESL